MNYYYIVILNSNNVGKDDAIIKWQQLHGIQTSCRA